MKKFFANHYEKVILVSLLILCVGLLFFQLTVVRNAQDEKVDRIVNRQDPKADFPKVDYSNLMIFTDDVMFCGDSVWTAWRLASRDVYPENADTGKIDLMTGQQLSVCPYCLYAIPSSSFPKMDAKESGKCPKCGKELKPRSTTQSSVQVEVASADEDSNSNKIPDGWEKKYGIFDKNAGSAVADADADGDMFTNYEEYVAKTNPKDAKSHPLYITLLKLDGELQAKTIADFLKEIKHETVVDIQFYNLNSSADTVTFDVSYLDLKKKPATVRKTKTKAKLNEEIKLKGKFESGFIVSGIVPPDKSKKGKERDYGSVKIKRDLGNGKSLELVCFAKKPVQMPDKQVNFDLRGGKLHFVVGDTFELGSETTGKETYTVSKVVGTNADDTEVVLTDKAGKTYTFRLKPVEAEPAKTESKK